MGEEPQQFRLGRPTRVKQVPVGVAAKCAKILPHPLVLRTTLVLETRAHGFVVKNVVKCFGDVVVVVIVGFGRLW